MRKVYKKVRNASTKITTLCKLFGIGCKESSGYFKDSSIHHAANQIVESLGELRDIRVSEIMIPRTDVIAISIKTTMQELYTKFITTKLTRIPVYKKNLDDIVGFVHIQDFLLFVGDKNKTFDINHALRTLIYTPRSTKCIDLLTKMRLEGTHLAVVLDEYGGTEGLITISCLLGSIVGEINDEHERRENNFFDIEEIAENSYILDAKTPIQDLEKKFGEIEFLSEEEGEYETMGGFILAYLGYIPEKGEKFRHPAGVEIEILEANHRRIGKIKLAFKEVDD